jgi:hypothetical protein
MRRRRLLAALFETVLKASHLEEEQVEDPQPALEEEANWDSRKPKKHRAIASGRGSGAGAGRPRSGRIGEAVGGVWKELRLIAGEPSNVAISSRR